MSTVETDTASSLRTSRTRQQVAMAGDVGLLETYHLEGGGNFGVWSYRNKNLLQKDGRLPLSHHPSKQNRGRGGKDGSSTSPEHYQQ